MPKDPSKPRGRMTAYAFFIQTSRLEHKKKHPDQTVGFTEFSRKCAEKWKSITEEEKKRFKDMADIDKMRYDREMKDYVPLETGEKTRRRNPKDPNAPKRSLSAFFWFSNDQRSKIKGMNPEYGVAEVAKELGRLWGLIDLDVKHKYVEMAERDRARYEAEMAVYKA